MSVTKEKLLILGGGPAGLTAAIYASRAGLDPLVFNGPKPGGEITTTSELENYPGFPEGIGGFELMQKITKQAEKFGARLVFEAVTEVNLDSPPYQVTTDGGNYTAESLIIATGSVPKRLGLEKEEEMTGSGVSYCATCDGAFFKDQEIAVVGGGDVALEEANYLSQFGSKVYLIHRRDKFRGSQILGDRVRENKKIEVLWNTEVQEILGEDKVEGLVVENNKNGDRWQLPDVRGFFLAVGYTPRTELFEDYLDLNENGFIITNNKQQASKPGGYAAGDVQDPYYQQVVTSAATGAKSALEAYKYLEGY
ncbi:MAG: thioredoxin-disulfide reductase [Bacillota bacterium]